MFLTLPGESVIKPIFKTTTKHFYVCKNNFVQFCALKSPLLAEILNSSLIRVCRFAGVRFG